MEIHFDSEPGDETRKVDLFKCKEERERRVAMKDLYFLLSRNYEKRSKVFGKSDIKKNPVAERIAFKDIYVHLVPFPLCNDVLTIHGIYLFFSSDPHQQYLSCVKVMGLTYVQIFFNASKILFYRLTYTVCQVFKRFICQQV